MKNAKMTGAKQQRNLIFKIIKSAVIAEVLTVVLLLVYAWILWRGILSQDSIPIVNSALKVVCAALAALMVIARRSGRRWLIGALTGVAYILLSFAVFSVTADHFSFSMGLLSDILMGGLAGMFTGMLVQLRK